MVRGTNAKLVLQFRTEGLTARGISLAPDVSCKSVLAVFDAAAKAGICGDGYAGGGDSGNRPQSSSKQ